MCLDTSIIHVTKCWIVSDAQRCTEDVIRGCDLHPAGVDTVGRYQEALSRGNIRGRETQQAAPFVAVDNDAGEGRGLRKYHYAV